MRDEKIVSTSPDPRGSICRNGNVDGRRRPRRAVPTHSIGGKSSSSSAADVHRLRLMELRARQVWHVPPALLLWWQDPLPFWLLLFDKLAGGWIEDLTESFSSSPSTDFASESQPSGSVLSKLCCNNCIWSEGPYPLIATCSIHSENSA